MYFLGNEHWLAELRHFQCSRSWVGIEWCVNRSTMRKCQPGRQQALFWWGHVIYTVRKEIQGAEDFSLVPRSIATRTPDGVQIASYHTAERFGHYDRCQISSEFWNKRGFCSALDDCGWAMSEVRLVKRRAEKDVHVRCTRFAVCPTKARWQWKRTCSPYCWCCCDIVFLFISAIVPFV